MRTTSTLSALACAALAAGTVAVLPAGASAAPTRYEAERAPATCDGTVDTDHAGYSGTGFCNGRNAVDRRQPEKRSASPFPLVNAFASGPLR
ncbi:hypothetical protein ACE14D_26940, partial [Streptomyces sp. Act-28]